MLLSFINISIDPNAAKAAMFTASWDTFLILIFAFAVFVYSFFVNRERLAVVLLSIYTALAIIVSTPLISNALLTFSLQQMEMYRLGIFIGLFAILYLLFSHNMSLRSEIGHHWWQAAILSFLQVGLLMSCILTLIPQNVMTSSVAGAFFTGDIPRSFWLLAPVASMIIMRPRHRHSSPPPQAPF
ncbi:hypothetical protein HY620_01110 [Candidatus Uhrbacteria bacterium]|nr:hypothetical protein [Candidatus Uhrbacteria bacterium]